jgi:hypothetical protein
MADDETTTDWAERTARAWMRFSLVNLGMEECVRLLLDLRTSEIEGAAHLDPCSPGVQRARDARILVQGALRLAEDGHTLLARAEQVLEESAQ